MSTTVFKRLPGVLSFQRGLVISDAAFYNRFENGSQSQVDVIRHGIRGTQNINKAGAGEKSTAADATRQEVSNIQTTDSAKLDANAQGLAVQFSVRFLDLKNVLFACAPGKEDADDAVKNYRDSVDRFIERAKASEGLQEVARRIARNIANGRWLWRNRTIARTIRIGVSIDQKHIADFDALSIDLHSFGDYDASELKVAEYIADGMRGDDNVGLNVEALLGFGISGAIEVFPSQNYVESKPRGFARPLYCLGRPEATRGAREEPLTFNSIRIMGQAALRDQKIANALRTIDTWYADYAEYRRPIPIEPNGASLEAQAFFRSKKTSAFEYAKMLNTLDPDTPEGMFMIASFIRGGVFSEGKES